MKPKCDDIAFAHLWEDTTPNIVYATMPPSYPPKTRRCKNCGVEQKEIVKQREIREWITQSPTTNNQEE